MGDSDAPLLQELLISVCEADLPDGRGRLAFLQAQRPLRKFKLAASERDGARGYEDHLLAPLTKTQEILDERLEPGAIDPAGLRVNEQCGAHLDDDAPGGAQG